MKIRIKFRKYGTMKFIGHLDMMRYFQKAMRRAEIDISYSEGYSPHQIMSFAAPLGVGITSDGEYLDIEAGTVPTSALALKLLNDTMVEGVEVLSFVQLPDNAKNAMSIVACADYSLSFKEGYALPGDTDTFHTLIEELFTGAETFLVTKKTKKSEKELDLKKLVYDFSVSEDLDTKKPVFYIMLSTGSESNLKPELVLQALFEKAGFTYNPFAIQIHRHNVYAKNESGSFIALDELGDIIE